MAAPFQIPGLSLQPFGQTSNAPSFTGTPQYAVRKEDAAQTRVKGPSQSSEVSNPGNVPAYHDAVLQASTPAWAPQASSLRAQAPSRSSSREEGELFDVTMQISSVVPPVLAGRKRKASSPLPVPRAAKVATGDGKSDAFKVSPAVYQVLSNYEKKGLNILSALLEHGYPRQRLAQDLVQVNRALNRALNDAPKKGSQTPRKQADVPLPVSVVAAVASFKSRSPPQVPQTHATSGKASALVLNNAIQQQHIPTASLSPAVGANTRPVINKVANPAPDRAAYMKKLEALKAAHPVPKATQPTLSSARPESPKPLVKKKDLNEILKHKIAALKAQNTRLDTAADGQLPSSLASSPASLRESTVIATRALPGSKVKAGRLTAADMLDILSDSDASNARVAADAEQKPFGVVHDELHEDSMIIEASSSESEDSAYEKDAPIISRNATYAVPETSIHSSEGSLTPASQTAPARGAEGPKVAKQTKTVADLQAEVEALKASIAAKESRRKIMKPVLTAVTTSEIHAAMAAHVEHTGAVGSTSRSPAAKHIDMKSDSMGKFPSSDDDSIHNDTLDLLAVESKNHTNGIVPDSATHLPGASSSIAQQMEQALGQVDSDDAISSDDTNESTSDSDAMDLASDTEDESSAADEDSAPTPPLATTTQKRNVNDEDVQNKQVLEESDDSDDETTSEEGDDKSAAMETDSDVDVPHTHHALQLDESNGNNGRSASAEDMEPASSDSDSDSDSEDEDDSDEKVVTQTLPSSTSHATSIPMEQQQLRPYQGGVTIHHESGLLHESESSSAPSASLAGEIRQKNYHQPYESRVRFHSDVRLDPFNLFQ